mgnify:CR=1 FL=1
MEDNNYSLFDLLPIVNFIIGINNMVLNQNQHSNQVDMERKIDEILSEIKQLREDISNVSE